MFFLNPDHRYLFKQWVAIHKTLVAFPNPIEFKTIIAMYSSPNRHYHGIKHIVYGLKTIDKLCDIRLPGDKDRAILKFAFFYHDIVYDVKKKDNEDQSAMAANKYLHWMSIPDAARVFNLILATADHQGSDSKDPLWDIMSDADLAVFSAPASVYRRYANNVWKEYSAIATRKQFVAGRMSFINNFSRAPIFKTHHMMRSEGTARGNLAAEFLRLSEEA